MWHERKTYARRGSLSQADALQTCDVGWPKKASLWFEPALISLRFFDTSQSVIVSLASAILFGITARPSHEELSAASKPNDDEADGN
jgi:hypothetical protein